jgi:hypothetical protein
MAQKLKSNLYGGADDRIVMLGDVVSVAQAEIEDLFPPDLLARIIARYLRGFANPEEYFDDIVEMGSPMVPQVKQYAKQHGIELELGWKVDVAKDAKRRLLAANDPMQNENNLLKAWTELFERLEP